MIRKATGKDIPELLEMASAMHAESPRYRSKTYHAPLMEQFFNVLLEGEDYCVFVSENDGQITAFFKGSVSTFFFSMTDKYASDLGFYVKPEFRGGGAAVKLIAAYEEWARKKGVLDEDIMIGVSSENTNLCGFLGKLSYNQTGELYRKNGGT